MEPFSLAFYAVYTLIFCGIFGVSYILSGVFSTVFARKGIVDLSHFDPKKKKHQGAIPLVVGSAAVLLACVAMFIPALLERSSVLSFFNYTHNGNWSEQILLFIAALLVLLAGGYVDDKYRIKPITQVAFVASAVVLVLLSGVRIAVESPWLGIPADWLGVLITALWLLICAAATKFLDGHDGLVTTVGITGFLGIASVALFDRIQEPLYAIFALVWAFALAGFLPYNFPKAKAYLGEGASIAIGFAIGYFSIVIGSKVVVSNAVLGLFLLDLVLVWVLRAREKRNFLTSGDRLHWHHRLLDAGLDKMQVLLLTTIILLLNIHFAVWLAINNANSLAIWQIIGFVITLSIVSFFLRKKRTS